MAPVRHYRRDCFRGHSVCPECAEVNQGRCWFPLVLPGYMKSVFGVCGALVLLASSAFAQIENVAIEITTDSRAIRVEASGVPQKSWSFRDTYAGVVGLGSRIRKVELFDERGAAVAVKQLAPGHFDSIVPAARIRYEVDLTPPARAADAAFVSWLTSDHGILQLNDLLPLNTKQRATDLEPVFVTVELPAGWEAVANKVVGAMRARGFPTAEDGAIIVGPNLRRSGRTVSGNRFDVVIQGAWSFSDQEALDTLLKVIQLHSEIGPLRCKRVGLVLATFPGAAAAANNWSAETRGCNVTLVMGQTPSRVGALAQLGNALTHETFHLWIPNGVALNGDYDWFYEGFTMYQAARAAVRLGLVTWPEFLNAIARAYDGSMATATVRPLSLIEASKQRWTIGAPSVYSKAMVVAFIYDLKLRSQSEGKRSLDVVYRRILHDHSGPSPLKQPGPDGNAAAMAALRSELPSTDFVERFIAAPVEIDLKKELAPYGLRVEKLVRTHVSVSDDINKRQRDLLKQLGYNEPRPRRK